MPPRKRKQAETGTKTNSSIGALPLAKRPRKPLNVPASSSPSHGRRNPQRVARKPPPAVQSSGDESVRVINSRTNGDTDYEISDDDDEIDGNDKENTQNRRIGEFKAEFEKLKAAKDDSSTYLKKFEAEAKKMETDFLDDIKKKRDKLKEDDASFKQTFTNMVYPLLGDKEVPDVSKATGPVFPSHLFVSREKDGSEELEKFLKDAMDKLLSVHETMKKDLAKCAAVSGNSLTWKQDLETASKNIEAAAQQGQDMVENELYLPNKKELKLAKKSRNYEPTMGHSLVEFSKRMKRVLKLCPRLKKPEVDSDDEGNSDDSSSSD